MDTNEELALFLVKVMESKNNIINQLQEIIDAKNEKIKALEEELAKQGDENVPTNEEV